MSKPHPTQSRIAAPALIAALWVLSPALLHAQAPTPSPKAAPEDPGKSSSTIHLDIEAVTDIPISLGVNLALELPGGWRASSGVGVLPAGYVSLINAVVESIPDTYDEATGDLIEETLQQSLVWRTHVGWQSAWGIYFDAGYGLITLGGGTSTEAVLAALTGIDAPSTGGSTSDYDIASTLHMIDLEVGWKRVYQDRWTVRAALGFTGTLAASSTVKATFVPDRPAGQRLVAEFEDFVEDYLVDTYTSYVFSPVVTVAFGYRFF